VVLRKDGAFRDGAWSLIPPRPAWVGNPTSDDFIAYAWHGQGDSSYVVAVNYSDHQAQCYLPIPFVALSGKSFRLVDEMGSETYDRDGNALISPGLYVDLRPWDYNLFRMEKLGPLT